MEHGRQTYRDIKWKTFWSKQIQSSDVNRKLNHRKTGQISSIGHQRIQIFNLYARCLPGRERIESRNLKKHTS